MRIPEKLKVGGKVYSVVITNNLAGGRANRSAEIDYFAQEIRLTERTADGMRVDFLHEMVHAILDFLGYVDHDEKEVDELANTMYMVIADNPNLFCDMEG